MWPSSVTQIADVPRAQPGHAVQTITSVALARPRVEGKFLFVGDEKFYIRGVTYGPFKSDADGSEYSTPQVVEQDFRKIAAAGFNAVRTYTVPPRWLLDLALKYGIRVMVGLAWEQHVTFLDHSGRVRDIETRIRQGVRACAGHPAVLCYTVGNEIPAAIVRWHGHRSLEQYLHRLYLAAKSEDPAGLVTYVNYPSTEYLHLPFLDFIAFNVYLESKEKMQAYLERLQNIASDRPLLMAEIGCDSLRHSEEAQADMLAWQVRTVFDSGCAGAFVFSWTDEWHRGGHEVTNWRFGLTDSSRNPRAALEAVQKAMSDAPFPIDMAWPKVSVVVCTYNGSRTIRSCLEGVTKLEYPNYEVIVVDDGSTDGTADIVRQFESVRLIRTVNRGLSHARNVGMEASAGEIVAYTDDDAFPDPHWLSYLVSTLLKTDHAGIGGPNIAPPDDGLVADCVAHAPGGPTHVLLTDQVAEHIPGCNMAFRKDRLKAINGFDPQFRIAGDDVDLCWRLQEQDWTLGYCPAAMVWHRRRNSVRAYWRQQLNYGKAEADLERKWPGKYNAVGHLTWAGRLYSKAFLYAFSWLRRRRIYHGQWGSALFQSAHHTAPAMLWSLPAMPEWYLVITSLGVMSVVGTFWHPLVWTWPLFVLSIVASLIHAGQSAARATQIMSPKTRSAKIKMWALTAALNLIQPAARLCGRMRYGLTPWRRRGVRGFAIPTPRTFVIWSEKWQAYDSRLQSLEAYLRHRGAVVLRGGEYDRWDLELRGSALGAVRIHTTTEEHGGGKQLVRVRVWPVCSPRGGTLGLIAAALATWAAFEQNWLACAIFAFPAVAWAMRTFTDCASATATTMRSVYAAWSENPPSQQKSNGDAPRGVTVSAVRDRLLEPDVVNEDLTLVNSSIQ